MGKQFFWLALPAALNLLLHNAYGINDLYWVKGLGREAQAAVSLAVMVQILLSALYEGLGLGALSLSGRAHGAGHSRKVRRYLDVAIRVAILLSILVAGIGFLFLNVYVEALIPFSEQETEASILAERSALVAYLGPILAGGLFLCLAAVVDSLFVAWKDTRTPFLLQCLAVALNLFLNPILIFGLGPIPALGVRGAAIATVASRAVVSLLGLYLLSRRMPDHGEPESRSRMRVAWIMFRVGLPAATSIAIYSLVYQVMYHVVFPPFGPLGHASFGAGFRIEGLAFCTIWGLAIAAGSIVSNELGAGRVEEATRAIRFAVRSVLILTLPLALLFYLAPGPLAAFLSADSAVRRETIIYLKILALSQFAVGIQGVFDQSIASAGHSLGPMLSTGFWNAVRIPLSYLLSGPLGYGLPGIWWAINLTSYGKALSSYWIFRRGKWKEVQL